MLTLQPHKEQAAHGEARVPRLRLGRPEPGPTGEGAARGVGPRRATEPESGAKPQARYDAIIVGARVAGAATALQLARQGRRVLVIDRAEAGSDTLSTLALMRGGVLQLARWGVLDALTTAGTPPIKMTTFHYADDELPIPIKDKDGVDALYAPRRTVLDVALANAASRSGAEFMFGARLVELTRDAHGRVGGIVMQDRAGTTIEIGARIVIGADGLRSTVARLVGAEPYRQGRHAAGVVYGYWQDLDLDGYHWYYRPGVSAGTMQTNGAVLVFAAVPMRRFMEETRHDMPAGYHRVLRETSPSLADAVARATQVERFWGFPGQVGLMRQSWGSGWALVGDAGYFKDPLTAHGMTDALRDAERLACAVAAETDEALAAYQATRDELSSDLFEVTDQIASFEWNIETVQAHHHRLSKEMNREVKAMLALDAPVSV